MRDAGSLGIVDLTSTAPEDREKGNREDDDPEPPLPLSETAPEEDGVRQALDLVEDRGPRRSEA